MTQIRVNTEHVGEVGRQISAGSDRLAEIGHVLQNAIGSLDTGAWDGISRARAEPLLSRAGPESARLVEELRMLSHKLARVARGFEEKDNTAARNLAGMPWVDWDAGGDAAPMASGIPGDDNPDFDGVRDAEGAQYGLVSGQPFMQGRGDGTDIHPNDVAQGRIGDCYLMAALAGIALHDPEVIRRMIRDNGDGTYTVTLHQRRFWEREFTPVEVVVTPEFPLRDGRVLFAQPGDSIAGDQELWPMLVEKAYAQHNGGYDDIVGGWGHVAMETLTGVESERFSPSALDLDTLADYSEQGSAITVSSLPDLRVEIRGRELWDIPDASDIHPLYQNHRLYEDHVYYVTNVDREAGTVSIRNPWGWHRPEVTLSFEEFQGAFYRTSVNPLSP